MSRAKPRFSKEVLAQLDELAQMAFFSANRANFFYTTPGAGTLSRHAMSFRDGGIHATALFVANTLCYRFKLQACDIEVAKRLRMTDDSPDGKPKNYNLRKLQLRLRRYAATLPYIRTDIHTLPRESH